MLLFLFHAKHNQQLLYGVIAIANKNAAGNFRSLKAPLDRNLVMHDYKTETQLFSIKK